MKTYTKLEKTVYNEPLCTHHPFSSSAHGCEVSRGLVIPEVQTPLVSGANLSPNAWVYEILTFVQSTTGHLHRRPASENHQGLVSMKEMDNNRSHSMSSYFELMHLIPIVSLHKILKN